MGKDLDIGKKTWNHSSTINCVILISALCGRFELDILDELLSYKHCPISLELKNEVPSREKYM